MRPATEIEATYQVVTPCFCGGADGKSAELRLPSFKGVLRYWWRALAWSRYAGRSAVVREHEDRLFGSATGGQSRVWLRLLSPPSVSEVKVSEALGNRPGARYLCYGLEEGQRRCLQTPFDFTIRLRYHPGETLTRDAADHERESLVEALTALGLLGGLGAKSRKGFGSLNLEALRTGDEDHWLPPSSTEALAQRLAELRGPPARRMADLPEYTALSAKSHHLLALSNGKRTDLLDLIDGVGQELQEHRGESGADTGSIPRDLRRAGFGLPRHFGDPRLKQRLKPVSHDRRASPLFIHIHECGDTPVAVLSFLPARFLPQGVAKIQAGKNEYPQPPEDELYRPVHDFLNRLRDRDRRSHIADVVEVT